MERNVCECRSASSVACRENGSTGRTGCELSGKMGVMSKVDQTRDERENMP